MALDAYIQKQREKIEQLEAEQAAEQAKGIRDELSMMRSDLAEIRRDLAQIRRLLERRSRWWPL